MNAVQYRVIKSSILPIPYLKLPKLLALSCPVVVLDLVVHYIKHCKKEAG